MDGFHIEPFVVEEPLVFGGDDGALQVFRDLFVRHPTVLEVGRWIARLQAFEAILHECGRVRVVLPQSPYLPENPAVVAREHEREDGEQPDQQAAEPPRPCRRSGPDCRIHALGLLLRTIGVVTTIPPASGLTSGGGTGPRARLRFRHSRLAARSGSPSPNAA